MLLQSEVKRSFRFGGTTPNKLKLPEIADFSTVLEIKQSQKQMNSTGSVAGYIPTARTGFYSLRKDSIKTGR
jgi:hypothetical protein